MACSEADSAQGSVPGVGLRSGRWIALWPFANFFFHFKQMFLIRWLHSVLDYVSDCWDSLFHSNWYGWGVRESRQGAGLPFSCSDA